MEDLQEALRSRAHSMQQGICRTEQCLQVLASVQDEVHQLQRAQMQAIQDGYQKQLQDLTEAFEQRVLELQQQTHAQLADLQLATEDALHQAAQAVLEELQLESPVLHLPTATAGALWPTKPGSSAGSEVALELSLAALQQHADTGQPPHVAAACQQLISTDVIQVQQQHGSSRVISSSQKPCTAHAAPAAAQHNARGDTRPSLDAPDTLWSLQHEDQVALDSLHTAAQQQDMHAPADWCQQQQQQQEQPPQPSICWHQHQAERCAAQPLAQRAVSPPATAVMPSVGRSPSGSAAAGSPRAADAATDNLQQAPCQRRPGSSSSSSRSAGAATEQCASHGASLRQGAASPKLRPRMPPWQSLAGHSQGAVQQGVPGRQLRAVVSLPARRQAVPQPLTTRRVSATTAAEHAASVVLRRAPSLRQQLEAGWQQGLAKAAGKAADTSSTGVQQLQPGVVSRRGSLATIINDTSSDESGGDDSSSPGQQRRSLEVKRWSSLLRRRRGDAGGASLAPAVRNPGTALARSSSAQHRPAGSFGSNALDLLWE